MKALPVSLTDKERTLGWTWWALQLLILPDLLRQINLYLGTPLEDAQLNFLFYFLNFFCTVLLLRRFTLTSCKAGIHRIFHTLQSAFLGFAVYYLSKKLLGLATVRLFPDFVNYNDTSILQMLRESYTLASVGIVVLVPVAEELLYRGVIFGSLYHRSRFFAYLVSAVVFAAIHVVDHTQDPLTLVVSIVQYLPAGLCLGWAYARSGSILAPVLIHMAVNQIGILSVR